MHINFDELRKYVSKNEFGLTTHALEERLRKNITTEQMQEVVLKGTVAKKESDEITSGELTKYTIDWRGIRVVVKNDEPPLIISCRVKE